METKTEYHDQPLFKVFTTTHTSHRNQPMTSQKLLEDSMCVCVCVCLSRHSATGQGIYFPGTWILLHRLLVGLYW
jgi:hypothetical protein